MVSSQDDRLFPLEFQQRLARQRLGVEPVVVPGGHLVALARPDDLTTAILTAADGVEGIAHSTRTLCVRFSRLRRG